MIALDYSEADLKDVRATVGAMEAANEIPQTLPWITVNGDALRLPFPDDSIDRVVCSEVLEHIHDYRGAIRELVRVLKPGGLLFIHEINTRNVLFRFYMGYVFPSLNCIDEGIERWLLAHKLDTYTQVRVVEVRYFTFLPEFVPAFIVRLFAPVERFLERSAARVFSAHYMAVLQK